MIRLDVTFDPPSTWPAPAMPDAIDPTGRLADAGLADTVERFVAAAWLAVELVAAAGYGPDEARRELLEALGQLGRFSVGAMADETIMAVCRRIVERAIDEVFGAS